MDDGHIWFELFIIVLLVLGNAVCSLAEIAIVGARKTKLQELADEGKRGAAQALKLTGRKEELFSAELRPLMEKDTYFLFRYGRFAPHADAEHLHHKLR